MSFAFPGAKTVSCIFKPPAATVPFCEALKAFRFVRFFSVSFSFPCSSYSTFSDIPPAFAFFHDAHTPFLAVFPRRLQTCWQQRRFFGWLQTTQIVPGAAAFRLVLLSSCFQRPVFPCSNFSRRLHVQAKHREEGPKWKFAQITSFFSMIRRLVADSSWESGV